MKRKSDSRLLVKFAGGAAAQVLALMNAIFLREKNDKNFSLKYYPYSTGTYWPFAISFLVKDDELISSSGKTRGLDSNSVKEVGKIIRQHPLASKRFSYEGLLSIIRKFRLEPYLQKFRGERSIEGSFANLEKVTHKVKSVSGGFVPILNEAVSKEMDERFKSAGMKSPFSKTQSKQFSEIGVIHYRMGDKRAKFSHPADFGGDGIINPESFLKILENLSPNVVNDIYVVSDEPRVAQQVLASVGIEAKLNSKTGDIWEDIYLISQASIFIGSWSQVSQLGAICNVANGGRAFLPTTTQVGTKIRWKVEGVSFFEPKYLPSSHAIYKPEFELDDDAHSSYTKRTNL
jgi:hypothetical protein